MSTYSLKHPNKPTVFIWGDYKEKYRVDRTKTVAEVLKLYDALYDEVYRIVIHKKVDQGAIAVFEQCFTNKSKLLWQTSGNWIMQFTHYFSEFEELVNELINHKSSTVRLHLVQSLWNYLPTPAAISTILKKGLVDKSKQVRLFAASRIETLNRKEHLADLKAALEAEREEENTNMLKRVISLLENGYWIEDSSGKQIWLHFHGRRGISAIRIDRSELVPQRIAELINSG